MDMHCFCDVAQHNERNITMALIAARLDAGHSGGVRYSPSLRSPPPGPWDLNPEGRPVMSDVLLLSGISGLSFVSPFLSPVFFLSFFFSA